MIKNPNDPITDFFENKARKGDGTFAIAYALLELAEAQRNTAFHIKMLGNGDAATHLGAIENLAMEVKKISDAISGVADGLSSN